LNVGITKYVQNTEGFVVGLWDWSASFRFRRKATVEQEDKAFQLQSLGIVETLAANIATAKLRLF